MAVPGGRTPAGNVKTYIHHLRGVIPANGPRTRIESRRGAYRLTLERHECDATVFEDRVAVALTHTRPALVVEQLKVALELRRAIIELHYDSATTPAGGTHSTTRNGTGSRCAACNPYTATASRPSTPDEDSWIEGDLESAVRAALEVT
jgi:hypothetical protein